MDDYHFPPELFSLLKDAIPKLVRSKKDVLQVFRGAGVQSRTYRQLDCTVSKNPDSLYKYEIARKLLEDLNERGEAALAERRELLKCVVEWDDFSTCWEKNRAKAKGLVAEIRELVGKKDAFTRMNQERKKERRRSARQHQKKAKEAKERKKERESVQNELYSLFEIEDPQSRGKKFERVLTHLFELYNVSISSSFTRSSRRGGGVIEQVDGAIEIDGNIYLVEAKWYQQEIGVSEVSSHLQRIFQRADARALIISASGFSSAAVETAKEALSRKVVVLCELEEVVRTFVEDTSFLKVLKKKIQAAELRKEPFVRVA
jgi:restriction endonuclease Mrr